MRRASLRASRHTSACPAASPIGWRSSAGIRGGYSRRVLRWRISNRRKALFCVDGLKDAWRHPGRPEVFNRDPGAQFTRAAFTDILKREGVLIRKEGRGRAFDNRFVERLWRSVKHEDVDLKGDASMGESMLGLTAYFGIAPSTTPSVRTRRWGRKWGRKRRKMARLGCRVGEAGVEVGWPGFIAGLVTGLTTPA